MLDLSNLNDQQKEAVIHKNGPLLIVAGAGTGKTTVITKRVAWLIDQGMAKPDEILCLTFTDKAAGEMEERIDQLLPYGYVDLWVMTFHAFAERILRDYALEIGLSADFKLLDQTGQWMLIYNNLAKFNLAYYRPMGNPSKFITSLLTHFSRAKDEAISSDDYLDYIESLCLDADSPEFLQFGEEIKVKNKDEKIKELWSQEIARQTEIANAYHVYQKLLVDKNYLDFGDLILYCRRLLLDRPTVLDKLRNNFKYVLVDEFQDTNWSQYDLIKLISAPKNNLTVVGDDDQSIYKFRGASLSNILSFKKDYPRTKQIVLTNNYRSAQGILDLAYDFIQNNNPNRLEYQLAKEGRFQDKPVAISGFVKINKKLKACNNYVSVIKHLHYENLDQESQGVIKKIIDIKQNTPDTKWSDFVILVRANASAESFVQQLAVSNIPYQFLASQGLFTQSVILDLLSYLRLISRFDDSKSLYRILILSILKVSDEDLMKFLAFAQKKSCSLYEALKMCSMVGVSDDGRKIADKIVTNISKHAQLSRDKRVSEVAMAFMRDFGLKQYYETLEPLVQREIYSLLNHFWRFMKNFELDDEEKSVQGFLEYLKLTKEAGDAGGLPVDIEEGPDTVKVMTVHASKGLEFDYVFIVNMVDRRFPTIHRKDNLSLPNALIKDVLSDSDHHLEEERRLCYVGITRAKKGVFFTSALNYGGARSKKISRFVNELGFEKCDPFKSTDTSIWGHVVNLNLEAERAKNFDYTKYLPSSFSFSQLKVFQTCPWQYRYAFILKIPIQGRHVFSFGKTMHSTLQRFFSNFTGIGSLDQSSMFGESAKKTIPSLEELLKIYEQVFIDEWYLNQKHKEEYRNKGISILKEFYRIHKNNWPPTESLEKGFKLKLADNTIKGMIDRIDRLPNSQIAIIDYKTGSVPKRDSNIDKDQLIIYQIAAEQVFGQNVGQLIYYYLNENVAKTFTITEEDKEKTKQKVVSTIDQLKKCEFTPKPSKVICINCDYKDICPYRMI